MSSSNPPPQTPRIVGVITARMESTRLPGKALRQICGRAMVHHVFERVRGCSLLATLGVATDSRQIFDYCEQHQIPVWMTASSHQNGTERIHEVMQTIPADVYLNIQGDEPMIDASHLQLLVEPFFSNPLTQVTSLKTPLDAAEASNPNIVKAVTNSAGQALYFSRAPIPYPRDSSSPPAFYKHLGLYAYSSRALGRYIELPPSLLEQTERLEQLRFLENGIPIQLVETPIDTIGVDTEEDLQAVRRYFEALPGGR